MTIQEAIHFIQPAIPKERGIWADIGAGNGIFALALDRLLSPQSIVYALDKNIQALNNMRLKNSTLIVEAFDFNEDSNLPPLDGMLMANTLHYSATPELVLQKLLKNLKPNGTFILIEYELNQPRGHWIPYPIPFKQLQIMADSLPITSPIELARVPSVYGNNYIYLAKSLKI